MQGSSQSGNGSSNGSGAGNGGEGGQGDGGQQQQNNGGQQQQQAGAQGQQSQQQSTPDLKSLTAEQLAEVMDNPNFWQLGRMKELTGAAQELKTLKDNQTKADEKSLEEQKKFEDLATKRGDKITQLEQTIQDLTYNQALTNKLVSEGVVDIDAALKLADRSKLAIDANSGSVTGVDDTVASLKTDKAYLFKEGGQSQGQIGAATGGGQQQNGAPAKFKRSQLADPVFYQANRDAILAAQKAGLIEDDVSPAR